jgi:hypothetical protein
MDKSTSPAAPTDKDAAVPGHLPNELPKSAALDEEAVVPGRWAPNGYEAEPYDHDAVGDPIGRPAPEDEGDLDETDERMMDDGKGNGIPDPVTGDEDKDISSHLRGDTDKLCLGSPPEEKPTHSVWDEGLEPDWLNREINRYLLQEYPAGAGMVDPVEPPHGFYTDFDMDKDHGSVDKVHGFWYASPARQQGADGDPFRGDDPYAQMGFHSPKGPKDGTTHPAVSGEEGFGALRAPEEWTLNAGGDTSTALGANAKPAGAGGESEGEPEEGEEGEAGEGGEGSAGAGQAQGQKQE